MTATLESTTFADELLAASRRGDVRDLPFVNAVLRGEAPRSAVRVYAMRLCAMARSFPRTLGAALAQCDDRRVRLYLIGNMLEEEGIVRFGNGHELVAAPERSHAVLARRLARAAGASEEAIEALPFALSRWLQNALDTGDWIGALAFFGIGYEANVPAAYRLLAPALEEHYGFSRHDVQFLHVHFEADERHGRETAELLTTVATTDDERRRALAGARRGSTAFAELHRVPV
jgi:pyrroloquinoline quinone (PQQ) biosynthesis protein C